MAVGLRESGDMGYRMDSENYIKRENLLNGVYSKIMYW
jgi:hypothetical protein